MRKFFCFSLFIFSPMFAAQHLARALLIHRLPTKSITISGQVQNRFLSTSASCAADDRAGDGVYDSKMKSILTRMEKAGLDTTGWGINTYAIEKAFCRQPLPLIAAFYRLRGIKSDIDGFKDNLPEDRESRSRYFAAKNRVDEALVMLKRDPHWLEQYGVYVRGVKDGVISPIDEAEVKPVRSIFEITYR